MLTEIERMLAELRHPGRVHQCSNVAEGPRRLGLVGDALRAQFACRYCGGHNRLECSPTHCSVKDLECRSSSRSDDR